MSESHGLTHIVGHTSYIRGQSGTVIIEDITHGNKPAMRICYLSSYDIYLQSIANVWHKASSMEHPMRIELTNDGLLNL